MTKIFDTMEFRADVESDPLYSPFSYIRVDNEYQDTDEVPLDNSILKRKFRVWRALIPRDSKVNDGRRYYMAQSRIRNTWARITLGRHHYDR